MAVQLVTETTVPRLGPQVWVHGNFDGTSSSFPAFLTGRFQAVCDVPVLVEVEILGAGPHAIKVPLQCLRSKPNEVMAHDEARAFAMAELLAMYGFVIDQGRCYRASDDVVVTIEEAIREALARRERREPAMVAGA